MKAEEDWFILPFIDNGYHYQYKTLPMILSKKKFIFKAQLADLGKKFGVCLEQILFD